MTQPLANPELIARQHSFMNWGFKNKSLLHTWEVKGHTQVYLSFLELVGFGFTSSDIVIVDTVVHADEMVMTGKSSKKN